MYTVTLPTPEQVKVELDADPQSLGYAALETAQDWNGIVALMNEVRAASDPKQETIERRQVLIAELCEAFVFAEFNALAQPARDAMTWLTICAGNTLLDPLNANIRGFFLGAFAGGTETRANLIGLTTRPGSRAEKVWGDGVLVSDTLVEAAARLP